jgi:adenylate kinase family enzyme
MVQKLLNKIIIIGDSGRGKSTLAMKIAHKLNIPFFSTDDFLYDVKYSVYRNKQKAINDISKIYDTEKWIVEGSTNFLLQPGLSHADNIIYLKYKNIFSQWISIITRHFKRKDKNILRTLGLMKHVFYKRFSLGYRNGQKTVYERIDPYKDKIIILTSFKEINDFIESIQKPCHLRYSVDEKNK